MSEQVKKEIEMVLDAMVVGIMQDAEEKHGKAVEKIVAEHGEHLLVPSKFESFFNHDQKQLGRVLVRVLLSTLQYQEGITFDGKQVYKLEDVYLDYSFYESQVRRLIESYEGHSCCADKSRYLLNGYVSYIKTGKLPDFGDRSSYWIPEYGSPEAWMGVLERCGHLRMGHVDHFLEARIKLVKELEEGAEAKLTKIDRLLRDHSFFVSMNEEKGNRGDKEQFAYHFKNGEYQGDIVISKHNGNGYRLFKVVDGEEKRLGYSDKKPDWFEELVTSI